MSTTDQSSQTPSPTAMLAAQTKSLAELVEIQKAQNEQIEELQHQNERIIGALARSERGSVLTHVKIEDLNMPFMALVGFLVKLSLASIPAMIILALVSFVIVSLARGMVILTLMSRLFIITSSVY
jgi:sorbitol-specific phosphotransferase system component IIBC